MQNAETVTFGGSGLDRAAHFRGDPEKLAALASDASARVLPIWQGKPLFDLETRQPGWIPTSHMVAGLANEKPVFLGLDDGEPRFAIDVSKWDPDAVPDTLGAFVDPSEQHHPDLPDTFAFAELRANMVELTPRSAELVAAAKAILGWHQSHGFCAQCGTKTIIAQEGWQRDCPDCGHHHFPRTDPVVIMLITHGNSVLLGRSSAWPEKMYSLLAGFVEPGESIEGAVRRETFEEAGIRVGEVEYLSSQPWPFPASLMFGCRGRALNTDITIDPVELEDAIWVNREEMLDAFAGRHPKLNAPRNGAIANFLLRHWLADTLS